MPENLHQDPQTIRLAILGGGINSAVGRAHLSSLQLDNRFTVTAACFSSNEQRSQESASAYRLPDIKLAGGLASLVNDFRDQYDALLILTPTNLHFENARYCLENKIPLICEKAAVTDIEQAKQLHQLVHSTNGFMAVTYNYTGYPMVRELRELIKAGQLGQIQQLIMEMPQEGFLKRDREGKPIAPQGWRLNDEGVPTVSLDLGVHLYSMIHFLTGETPNSLVSTSDCYGHFNQIIDSVSCLAKCSGGITCNLWYTKAALGYTNGLRIRVFGSEGSAQWYQLDPEQLHLSDSHGTRSVIERSNPLVTEANKERYTRFKAGHPAGYIEAYANHYADIAQALTHHLSETSAQSPFVFGVDAELAGIGVMDAIKRSSTAGSWVTV